MLTAVMLPLSLGFVCWTLFSLAVYALPAYVAINVGLWANATGSGPVIAIIAAFLAGAATLIVGQVAFATIRSPGLRIALAVAFALPAGVAGFHAVRGLCELGGVSEAWTTVVSVVSSLVIGGTAWVRVAALAGPEEIGRRRTSLSGRLASESR